MVDQGSKGEGKQDRRKRQNETGYERGTWGWVLAENPPTGDFESLNPESLGARCNRTNV